MPFQFKGCRKKKMGNLCGITRISPQIAFFCRINKTKKENTQQNALELSEKRI